MEEMESPSCGPPRTMAKEDPATPERPHNLVYKHAISTVVPARAVPLGNEQQGTEEAETV